MMLRRSIVLLVLLILAGVAASCGGELVAEEPGKWDGDWNSTLDSGTVFLLEARGTGIAASTDLGFFVSSDQGEFYDKPVLEGLGENRISGIVLRADKWFAASNQGQLWESTTEGFKWTSVGSLPVASEVRLSAAGQDLVAALKSGRVYRSTDDGRSWNLSDTGIAAKEVRTIFYHNTLLLAAPILEPVLYRSTDFGEVWTSVDSGYDATAVLDFTGVGKDIYAAAGDKGIYHSTDKGISWESMTNGLPARTFTQVMHADKKVVYVGGTFSNADESDHHILYRTLDYGKTWNTSDEGLPAAEEVTGVSASSNFIVVGTRGKGIWRRRKG
jgi:photosystem II stability/assembly factor-like uncharacterized protein